VQQIVEMYVRLVISRSRLVSGPFEYSDSIEAKVRLPKGRDRSSCLNHECLLVGVRVALDKSSGELKIFNAQEMHDEFCLIKDDTIFNSRQRKEIFAAAAEAGAKMCIFAGNKKSGSGRVPLPVCIIEDSSDIAKFRPSPPWRYVKIKVCTLCSSSSSDDSLDDSIFKGESTGRDVSSDPPAVQHLGEAPQAALIDESLAILSDAAIESEENIRFKSVQGVDVLSRLDEIGPSSAQGEFSDASDVNIREDNSASTFDLKGSVSDCLNTGALPGKDNAVVGDYPDKEIQPTEEKSSYLSAFMKGVGKLIRPLSGPHGVKEDLKDLLHSNCKWLDESEHKSFVAAKSFLDPESNWNKYVKKVEDVLDVLNNMEISLLAGGEIDPLVLVLCAGAFNSMLERCNDWNHYPNKMRFKSLAKSALQCFLKLVSAVNISSESVGLLAAATDLNSELLCCASKDLDKCVKGVVIHFKELSHDRGMQSSILSKIIFVRCFHCGFAFKNGLSWGRLKDVAPGNFCIIERAALRVFLDKQVLLELSIFLAKSLDEAMDLCSAALGQQSGTSLQLPFGFADVMDSLMKRSCTSSKKNKEELESFIAKFVWILDAIIFSNSKNSRVDLEEKERLIRTFVDSLPFETTGTFGAITGVLKSARDHDSFHQGHIHDCISLRIQDDLRVCDSYKYAHGIRPKPADVQNLLAGEYGILLKSRDGESAVIAYAKSVLNRQQKVQAPAKIRFINVVFKRYLLEGWSLYPIKMKGFVLSFLEKVVRCQMNEGRLRTLRSIWCIAIADFEIFLPESTNVSRINRIIETMFSTNEIARSIALDYKLLFDLQKPVKENFSEVSLHARLCKALSEKLYYFFPDSVKCMDWSCKLLCDTASPVVARSIASDVLCLTLPSCMPRQFQDVLKISEPALLLLSTQLDQDTSLESLVENFVTTMKRIICQWSSDFESNNLSLADFAEVSKAYSYSTDQWSMIEKITQLNLPSIDAIKSKITDFDELKASIRTALVFKLPNGEETNLRAVLRGYLSDTDKSDLPSLHDSLERSECIVKNGLGYDESTSLRLLIQDEQALAVFRRKHDFEFQVGAYFLSSQSQLFLATLGFGEGHTFPTTELLQRLKEASLNLCDLFVDNATFKDLKGAARKISQCNGDVAAEICSIASCPGFEISGDAIRRVILVCSLAHIGPHLRKFVDCCKQFSFAFVDGDKSFDEICSIADSLNNQSMDVWTSQDCAKQAILLYSLLNGSVETPAVELINLMELLPMLKLFEKISDCSEVWALAHDNDWFGDDGLVLFYKEYENVTNVLLGEKSIETKILDSLAPSIRCVSKFGGALKAENVSDIIDLVHSCQFLSDEHNAGLFGDFDVVQTNVSQIRKWFTDGIDDMAAMLNTFTAVLSSGIYYISHGDHLLLYLQYQPSFGEIKCGEIWERA